MTPDQEKRALSLLESLSDNECQFSFSRKWVAGRSCGEDNGRGFNCSKCAARDLIAEIKAGSEDEMLRQSKLADEAFKDSSA